MSYGFVTGQMSVRASACAHPEVWKKGGDDDGDIEWRYCAFNGFELSSKHSCGPDDSATLSAYHVAHTDKTA